MKSRAPPRLRTGSSKLATVRRRMPKISKSPFQNVWASARSRSAPVHSRTKVAARRRISFHERGIGVHYWSVAPVGTARPIIHYLSTALPRLGRGNARFVGPTRRLVGGTDQMARAHGRLLGKTTYWCRLVREWLWELTDSSVQIAISFRQTRADAQETRTPAAHPRENRGVGTEKAVRGSTDCIAKSFACPDWREATHAARGHCDR